MLEAEVERELKDQKPQGILSVHPFKSSVLYLDFLRNWIISAAVANNRRTSSEQSPGLSHPLGIEPSQVCVCISNILLPLERQ